MRGRWALSCALVTVGCGPGEAPGPATLEASALVLPTFDSVVVQLADGTGEVRDADSVRVVEAGLTDWRAEGDFDGDGTDDALAVVWASGGGSGTFMELALFALESARGRERGGWQWRASGPLGDRVRVRALTVTGSDAEVHLTVHGPDDPMCCPTQETVRAFRVQAGGLEEIPPSDSGDAPSGGP